MVTLPATERSQLPLDPEYLFYGLSYALGKDMRAVLKRVTDDLIAHRHILTAQERKIIAEDITNAIERDTAGGLTSVEQWRRVKDAMLHG